MTTSLGNLVLLLAAAQGYFLSILILHKHGDFIANRVLAALMLVYSILLTHLFLGEAGVIYNALLMWLVIGLSFIVGPLHYLYARYLINPDFNYKHLLNFLPFVIYSALAILAYLYDREGNAKLVQRLLFDFSWYHWTILAHVIVYMSLSLCLLRQYAQGIKDVFSDIHKVKLDWLRNLTLLAFVIMFVYFAENFFLLYNIELSHEFDLSSIIIALYVYTIGYLGMLKSQIFNQPAVVESIKQLPVFKYEKSGLTEARAAEYEQRLLQHMRENRPWLDSELTLAQLAKQLDMPGHYLSEIINSRQEQNFFNFVNHYRLEQVKKDLLDPAKKHLKILAIAYDAGFNSKSTFNGLFKTQVKMTPSMYRHQG